MNYARGLIFVFVIAAGILIINSCKHDIIYPDNYGYKGKPNFGNNNQPPTPPAQKPCSPDTIYFESQVLPLLISNCSMCHKPGGSGGEEDLRSLDSYSAVMNSGYVRPGNPNGSSLYESLTASGEDLMPPPPKKPLTSQQIDLIKKWIQQGAKDYTCNYCDTSKYTFSGTIFPAIQLNCIGCHSGSPPSGGISLTNYNEIKTIADNGKFVCAITHSSGCFAMPASGTQLSDCLITQIKNWIKNGSNND